MLVRLTVIVSLIAASLCATARAEQPLVDQAAVRAAVEKSLPLLMTAATGHRENRTCFACHNQALPMLAGVTARAKGFPFPEVDVQYQTKYIAEFLDKNRSTAVRVLRAYSEGIHRVRTDKDVTMKVLAKYTKVNNPEILAELYRIYGAKYLERIPRVRLDAVEEVLRSEVKTATGAKASDFVDNSLVAELEQQGLFQSLYR